MQENVESSTAKFLAEKSFAVAGASRDRSKYGNKVFQALVASGRTAYPLNPSAPEVERHPAFATIADLPEVPESLSIVTPPHVTRQVIQQAIAAGVKNIWMQPGAEDSQGSNLAREAGLNVIDDGSCVLVSLAIERSQTSS
ncbi:MAG: CoA-binding protein [Planctomycetales bacterium]|nr:CoA-binding protein [Planctomycetales bacterium]